MKQILNTFLEYLYLLNFIPIFFQQENPQNNKMLEDKQNFFNERKQQYRNKLSKIIHSCPREKMTQSDNYSQIASSRQTNVEVNERNWVLNQKRRQNQLNSLFRIRKQKLQSITKFNKQFYVRLNSQQSHYRSLSKDKEQGEKAIFTFRTVDSKQSRQILGPIGNFNLQTTFKLQERLKNNKQNEKNGRLKNNLMESPRILRESLPFSTPSRKKIASLLQDPQIDQNLAVLSDKRYRKLTQYQEADLKSFLKTPQRSSKLPEIYSFF